MDLEKRQAFLGKLAQFYLLVPCSEESGIRTPLHNAAVHGATDSAHVQGVAQDVILDPHVEPGTAIYHAIHLGFLGIEWDERNQHLHLDMHLSGRRYWVTINHQGISVSFET